MRLNHRKSSTPLDYKKRALGGGEGGRSSADWPKWFVQGTHRILLHWSYGSLEAVFTTSVAYKNITFMYTVVIFDCCNVKVAE